MPYLGQIIYSLHNLLSELTNPSEKQMIRNKIFLTCGSIVSK